MDGKKIKNISDNLLNIHKEELNNISDKLLNIKGEIKHVTKDAFDNKNKLNDDDLKNVCAIFDAFSRRCSKNEKEAIKCFEIAAKGDHEEAIEARKQLN
ncbi:15250_t:CDS:2 [Gigaspora margarita]|uniref:15250_t:CDS:1 n=1 Tax=Gigaspora margarita TaxID=4874 RepID=A0ABN7UWA6_GIGMA|nr:15250_t:CDS:2 [Gigaspora margarita]